MAAGILTALAPFLPLLLAFLTLYGLSALTFHYLLGNLAMRLAPRGWGRRAFTVLRAPANILHEGSHAGATWLAGYRVAELRFCFTDPEGRGLCRPGSRWAPWGRPWLLLGLSGLAPTLAGATALAVMARLAGVAVPRVDLAPGLGAGLEAVVEAVAALRWDRGSTWAFLAAAVLVGAEVHPSGTDLRLASGPVAITLIGYAALGAFTAAVPEVYPVFRAWMDLTAALSGWLTGYATLASVALAIAVVVVGPPAWALAWFVGRSRR